MTITTTSTSRRSLAWPGPNGPPFVVPLGVGAQPAQVGDSESRVVELDWHESHQIGELTLVCTPARHFSGRLFSRNTTLWAVGDRRAAATARFFGGDTGYTKSFAEIGMDHGPFRPDPAADRGVSPGVAGHPHEPRGWPSARTSTSPGRLGVAGCRFTGHVPAGASSVGRTGRANWLPPRIRRACAWLCQAGPAASIPTRSPSAAWLAPTAAARRIAAARLLVRTRTCDQQERDRNGRKRAFHAAIASRLQLPPRFERRGPRRDRRAGPAWAQPRARPPDPRRQPVARPVRPTDEAPAGTWPSESAPATRVGLGDVEVRADGILGFMWMSGHAG